jgi:hypothetical protein
MHFRNSTPNLLGPGWFRVYGPLYRFGPGLTVVWSAMTATGGFAFRISVPDLRGPRLQFQSGDIFDIFGVAPSQRVLSPGWLSGSGGGGDSGGGIFNDDESFFFDEFHDPSVVLRPVTDRVSFALTGPRSMVPGHHYALEVWAHLEGQRNEVIRRAGETQGGRGLSIATKAGVPVGRGTTITVRLRIPDLVVSDPEDTIYWDGEIANATFIVSVPPNATPRWYAGTVTFSVAGLQVARLQFVLVVGAKATPPEEIHALGGRICSAFASYASEDRDDVLARVQGIKKILPDLDVFLDVLSLRSGENWARRLVEEIRLRDVFYLFWSLAAKASEWVEREWRAALEHRGLDFISPVPLVPPRVAPPPKELASLHFNDPEVEYLERRKADGK